MLVSFVDIVVVFCFVRFDSIDMSVRYAVIHAMSAWLCLAECGGLFAIDSDCFLCAFSDNTGWCDEVREGTRVAMGL